MRRIDGWIGLPLIRFLGLFTRKQASLYGDFHPEKVPNRVVCTKFIGLGSVVLSLPLLKALKDKGAKVAFWSFPGQAEIARSSGYVDEVWVIKPSLKHFLPSLIGSYLAMRRFNADAFLDLEPTANFSAILARLSGAAIRVGYMSAKPARESLFTHLVALTSERHMAENNFCMGQLIGVDHGASSEERSLSRSTMLPPAPAFKLEVESQVEKLLAGTGAPAGRKRVFLNVNASDLSLHRMWKEDHWIKLASELLKDPSVDLVFPGAHSEKARVQAVIDRIHAELGASSDRLVNLAGRTSLFQLMASLKTASLVVSVDSGIMHLAAWMGVPVVGMFGPETPRLYGPRTAKSRVLTASLPCSPCLSVAADKITRCTDNVCMKKISPERALAACRSLMAEAGAESEKVTAPGFAA